MSKKNSDHIVVNGKEEGRFECHHCGAHEDPGFPISLGDLPAIIDEFVAKHIDCNAFEHIKTLTFTGGGDDSVYVKVETYASKGDKCTSMEQDQYGLTMEEMTKFNIGDKMTVYAFYDGTWGFGVGQWDEDIPLPNWPVRFLGSEGYTSIMQVDVPAGMPFTQVTDS